MRNGAATDFDDKHGYKNEFEECLNVNVKGE